LDEERLLNDLKDPENRRLFYAEHISTGIPVQIRELRKKRKMTQKALASATGIDQSNISDFENLNYEYTPQIGTLKRLADAFDVPLIVRFGSWEEVWDWEYGLSPKKLAPCKFKDALPRLESKVERKKTKAVNSQDRDTAQSGRVIVFPVSQATPQAATQEAEYTQQYLIGMSPPLELAGRRKKGRQVNLEQASSLGSSTTETISSAPAQYQYTDSTMKKIANAR